MKLITFFFIIAMSQPALAADMITINTNFEKAGGYGYNCYNASGPIQLPIAKVPTRVIAVAKFKYSDTDEESTVYMNSNFYTEFLTSDGKVKPLLQKVQVTNAAAKCESFKSIIVYF